jgi:hypothetical protein
MGWFYTNVTLYKAQQQQVADFLARQKRKAYVSPTVADFTVVYDKETEDQDTAVLKKLTESLTKKLRCRGLASLVHDSDVYMYWLYDNGKLLDTYNSFPGYFDSEVDDALAEGGDVQKLCKAFEKQGASSESARTFALGEQGNLSVDIEQYLQGEGIHSALVRALGMPPFAAYGGYNTIENNDVVMDLDRKSLIRL